MEQAKGAALLTALFIMTLVAIVATAMTMRLQQEIYRTRLILAQDSLYLASQAVTFWDLQLLRNQEYAFYTVLPSGMVAQFPDNLAKSLPNLQLSGGLYDLQAQMNLNNLVNPKSLLGFANLIFKVLPKTNTGSTIALVEGLHNWLQPYQPGKGQDEYMAYGLAQNPPYYPGHQLMQSKSELRLVKGMDAAIYLALEPLITALPQTATAINLNTAPKALLSTLGNGLNAEQVEAIVSARGAGIKDMKDLAPVLQKMNVSQEQLTLKSEYFLAVATASNQDFTVTVYTLMHRVQTGERAPIVTIVRESINAFVF